MFKKIFKKKKSNQKLLIETSFKEIGRLRTQIRKQQDEIYDLEEALKTHKEVLQKLMKKLGYKIDYKDVKETVGKEIVIKNRK